MKNVLFTLLVVLLAINLCHAQETAHEAGTPIVNWGGASRVRYGSSFASTPGFRGLRPGYSRYMGGWGRSSWFKHNENQEE